ncbi:MAG: S41 family peptidase [bacterium]
MRLVPLLILFFSFWLSGCDQLFFEPEPKDSPVENFRVLWNTFNERYAPFKQRGVDWQEIYETFQPRVDENTQPRRLFLLFVEMLAKLDDGHVTLIAPNEEVWNANRILRLKIDDELFDLDLIVRQYLEAETVLRAEAFTCGVIFRTTQNLNISIGYIHIQHFQGDLPKVIDDILERLQSSEVIGIILDVRHNFGGDFRNGLFVASRFTDRKKLAFTSKAKNGPGPDDFASPVKWYIEPGGDRQFTKPVIALTDRYTISAAERTVMALKELPHVQIIGDSTSGSLGEKIGKELPNGWFFTYTPQIVFAASGESYEGKGIPPNTFMTNTKKDAGISDRILNQAIFEMLRLLAGTK